MKLLFIDRIFVRKALLRAARDMICTALGNDYNNTCHKLQLLVKSVVKSLSDMGSKMGRKLDDVGTKMPAEVELIVETPNTNLTSLH